MFCYLSGQWVFCFVLLCFVLIPTLEEVEVYCSFFGVSPVIVAVVCVLVCLPGCPLLLLLLLLVFWGSSVWLGEYRTVLVQYRAPGALDRREHDQNHELPCFGPTR